MGLHKIELSQQFAKEATHTIDFHGKNYEDFMATKFVYSMMTFNIIYNKFGGERDFVKQKIEALVDDLFNTDEKIELFYEEFKKFNIKSSDESKRIIDGIRDDSNIRRRNESDIQIPKRSYKNAFKGSFNSMIDNEKATQNEILLILLYINQIRNNLFHGSKDIEHAMNSTQNKRLKIYSDIILAVNEVYIQKQRG